MSSETFVIVGAGLAGAKAAESLREQGFDGRVVLLGAETHRPYERPPLSKSYLAGASERGQVFVHPEDWYRAHAVELRLGQPVTGLDRAVRRVQMADGTTVDYDKVLIATGAAPRTLHLPGADAAGVHCLRTLDDSEALRDLFVHPARMVVIGAGWIGLEVTAAARQAGVEVTVVESTGLPLLRVLGPEMAEVFAALHREHGVHFRFDASVAAIRTDNGRATGVVLGDGTAIDADAVLVAVGAAPNSQIAEASGLDVGDGILVDAALRTSDSNIFAAGDVANAMHPLYGKHIRVEHWANALNQPANAAASMLGGDRPYEALPYFYTDQFELGMEYFGYVDPGGYDEVVVRGDVAGREFIAFWLKDGRVLAGMNVNVWDVGEPIKALIASRAAIDTGLLTDTSTDLTGLLKTTG